MTSFSNAVHPNGQPRTIAVIGGTGFLGRHIVRKLAKDGFNIRVLSRHATRADYLKPVGSTGQITLMNADLNHPETIAPLLAGCDGVVNAVGILFERGKQQFSRLHAQGVEQLAKAARAAGVTDFVHISAIGVDKPINSKYARTKSTGEKALRAAFPDAVILRPSIIFGPEDNFFNQFAALGRIAPALPLIGGGKTLFQPVYVGDVALAVSAVLMNNQHRAKTYELGGPSVLSFAEILRTIATITGNTPWLVPLPFDIASLIAGFTEWLPTPPLTRDQVRLLRIDNCVSDDALTLADLGLQPTHIDSIVPHYLARYRRHNYAGA